MSYRLNVDGMYVLLCAPWCWVEAPWVGQAIGVGVVFPVSPVWLRVRLCRWFLAGCIFDHGGVRAGCLSLCVGHCNLHDPECQNDAVLILHYNGHHRYQK